MINNLIIRADAGRETGTGHVMRSLALAQAWRDKGGKVFFALSCELPSLEDRLKKEGMQIIPIPHEAGTLPDANETARIARERGADWVVVDGYQFGADYQKTIHDVGLSLLTIDDYGHAGHYYADLVLNQNIYADMLFYKNYEPYTRFLLGTHYSLIRKEFIDHVPGDRTVPEIARKILVTFGGSDPDNRTLAVIGALKLAELPDTEVTVVVGGANPHCALIQEALKDFSHATLVQDSGNMSGLMAWADAAISAGGSTCWELLFMNVPSLVLSIAENQDPIVKELDFLEIAQAIDPCMLGNPQALAKTFSDFFQSRELRADFSQRMSRYVDGRGASRVIGIMCGPRITLRKADFSDCEQVWSWINDPSVRSVSFSSATIPMERHRVWFTSALADPSLVYYIALESDARPLGQVRFQSESGEAVISVLIDPRYRGISLGSTLIRHATEQFFKETGIGLVKAFIKIGNEVSRKAFANAGYRGQGLHEYNGEEADLWIKKRGMT